MTTASLGFAIDSSQAAGAASDLDRMTSSAARAERAAASLGASSKKAFAQAGAEIVQFNARVQQVAKQTETLAEQINRSLNVRMSFNGAERGKDIAEYGRQLDSLRSKFNPIFSALTSYKTTLGEIRQAHKLGAISADEMAAAISRERQATLANIQAQKGRLQGSGGFGGGTSGFRRQNLGYQAFDIGQGLAGGISPAMIAAQQGPQIAQLYAGSGGIKAALQDVSAIAAGAVASVGALPLALGAATLAAIAFGSKFLDSSKKAEEALEKHEETLKRIKGLFDNAGTASEQYGQRVQGAIDFSARSDRTGLEEALAAQTKAAGTQLLNAVPRSSGAAQATLFGPYLASVQHFIAQTREGKGDIKEFNDEILRIANDNPADTKIQKIAQRLLETTKAATETAQAIKDLNDEVARTTMLTARTDAAAAAQRYNAGNVETLFQLRRSQGAALASIGARSPQQIAAAARARAEAEPVNPNESPEVRKYRIETAAALALAQAEQQVRDAQRDRALNLGKITEDQQMEIDLIGKTGGAAVALRKEYELTSQLRLDAARQGIEVDQAELDLIKDRAAALGELTDQYNKRRFDFDMGQQTRDGRLSDRDRGIVTTLRSYGLREDLGSPEASRIGQQMDWQEAKDLAKGFGSTFGSELISTSGDIGKSFAKALQSSLERETEKLWDKVFDNLGNLFADLITGAKGKSSSSASGGVGALASAIFGGAANDNGKAPVTPVTRMPLGDISSYAKAIQSIESGGNYGALGPLTKSGDRAYGAYQVMGANIPSWTKGATGQSLTPNQFLANSSAQDAVFSKYFGASVSKYGNPQDAASVWFTGRPRAQGAGASDILGTTGSAYVDKFNNALGGATKNLGGFGDGLGKLGQAFSTTAFPAAPTGGGGGGLFSWLGGLFGAFKPIGAQATLAASGSISGLFADGTNYAPGGMAIVGERGPELVNLPQGSQVTSNHKLMSIAANGNSQRAQAPKYDIHIHGASGDQHIRDLVQQGVTAAQVDQNNQMRRGSFGDMQRRYSNQKG
ncbi:phage tail length tape measure family protein [Rhizobium favelukesii]|uniref:phage tail length tape measure family protein n=1 Tax=Rhizobium favelukesii TaxID=348824 RepID=UPI00215DED5E|nr:phage tail length tape measure family protein [Rhizobium favelukesii]MCS0459539.1 phage tail length tape measure family protein [Rhizobium favelukesii]